MVKRDVILVIGMVLISLGFVGAADWSEEYGVNYRVGGADFLCDRTTETGSSFWVDRGGNAVEVGVNDVSCLRSDNGDGEPTCCPIGKTCDVDSEVCEDDLNTCEDYDKDDCDGAPIEVAVRTVEIQDHRGDAWCGSGRIEPSVDNPGEQVIIGPCHCEWNDGADECQGAWDETPVDSGGNPGGSGGVCLESSRTVSGNCDENEFITVAFNRTYRVGGMSYSEDPARKCIDETKQVPCGTPLVKLPFFTWINLIILVVILIVFYAVWKGKKRGKKKGKRKRKK